MIEKYKTKGARRFTCKTIGKDNAGRKITQSAEYFDTELGSMELGQWYAAVKEAAAADGLTELLEAIKEHCRQHCAWLKKETDVEKHALECLVSGAYNYWPGLSYHASLF